VTARVLRRGRDGYPPLLGQLHDPPSRLYLRGDAEPELLARPAVAVVGARACSSYGAHVARVLGRELAAAGVVVVSGLARGIDAEAHRGALEAGTTVAVLGCGIDRDYPRAHAELARRVAADGLVVSEYGPGVEPAPWRFPARNRVVAGLALATIVVEARERSGALITADFALELGRELFAVPGEITSALSAGTNGLLRQAAAAPYLGLDDVLGPLGLQRAPPASVPVSPPAREALTLLVDGARTADEVVRLSGRPSAEVAAALVELELVGLVCAADGVYRAVAGAGRAL